MTTHEITTDLTVDERTGDHAYRAFCETCDWADPAGWHHSGADPSWTDEDWDRALALAYGDALLPAAEHRAEAADDPDPALTRARFQALPIPTTDQNGYAHSDAAL